MVDPKLRAASATPFARWRKLIPSLPRNSSDGASPDKDSGPLINTCTSVAEEKRGNGDIINKNEVDRNGIYILDIKCIDKELKWGNFFIIFVFRINYSFNEKSNSKIVRNF